MSNFSDEAKVFLINLVSEQRVLYDPTNPDYRSISIRRNIWDEIGKKLSKNAEACKEEWEKLKGCYDRYQKSSTKRSTENVKFFTHMSFLSEVKLQQQIDENPQKGIGNDLGPGNRASESNNSGQQCANLSSVQVQVNVVKYEGTSVPVCENSPLARPKPAHEHQKKIGDGSKKKNKDNAQKTGTTKKKEVIETNKSKKTGATPKTPTLSTRDDELDIYCGRLRNKLGSLPDDLLINAKTVIDQLLSDLMETALSRGSTSNATV